MAPPPPVIEGTLKNTINSLGFGLITTVLSVTFGKMLIPNFFVWIVGFVVFIEAALLSIPRKAEEYEVYQAPGKKVTHNIEGSGAPQISINTPDDEDFRKKKTGLRERFKKDKHGKKDLLRPDAAEAGETSSRHSGYGNTSSPKRSPNMDRKAKEESHKPEKEIEKAEKAAEKAEKEKSEKTKDNKSKGKGESVDSMVEEQDDTDKNKNKGKGGWKKRLPHRKSQSLSDD